MDFQEQFFKEQIKVIHDARDAKEDDFEKFQQEKREKVKQSSGNPSAIEDPRRSRYGLPLLMWILPFIKFSVFFPSFYFPLGLNK